MDEEIERMIVSVRADTAAFARDVAEMRGSLEGPFEAGVERAGRALETTLLRAVRTGKLGFDDLGKVALKVLDQIAASAIRGGLDAALGGGGKAEGGLLGGIIGGGGGGLVGLLSGLISGAPGRATGGPVSPGRAYRVGERGPELFVPTASGRVETITPAPGGGREVRVAITVNAGSGEAPQALARSSRQVARAVKAALARVE